MSRTPSFLRCLLLILTGILPLAAGMSADPARVIPVTGKHNPDHEGTLFLKEEVGAPSDFPLVANRRAARIIVAREGEDVVRIAAGMLSGDIERVSGIRPSVETEAGKAEGPAVILGTVGRDPIIDELVKLGKLDVSGIRGQWESFLIKIVSNPLPGVPSALVIAGSDRRGTAFGAITLSEKIGVSPWIWWADVSPQRRKTLVVSGELREGPPSVKYRGIFINDEDWGLQPWAAKTYDPETNDIGPKTYARVCELLLRLKGNYLWPAMHGCTKAFNHYEENKRVADRYAIVMGSSHCEQMLRNNISEWPKERKDAWNPVTNLPEILDYWEERVRENGRIENIYTVGMRGIHDGSMPGGGSIPEKRDRLASIIDLQRGILARHVNPDPAQVPQIFCPYKEVLDIYQSGLPLPDDITIVWPDDNYGYIRQLPDAKERKRAGGSGIYYHISYLGRPHDYLWLDSTSPALLWHELTKAYELGARRVWVMNVGDIKPMETGISLFFQMAWRIDSYGPDVQGRFLRDFYTAQFGAEFSDRIATLKDEYYRLCAIRRPEHMGFNLTFPKTPVQSGNWSHAPGDDEAGRILSRWQALAKRTEALSSELPADSRDAYFELVEYPARAGAAMAEKMILAERARLSGSKDMAHRAEAAFSRIRELTARYESIGGGKWRGMMNPAPLNRPVFGMPPVVPQSNQSAPNTSIPPDGEIVIDPAKFTGLQDRSGTGWRVIEGLGPRGRALALLPQKDTPTLVSPDQIRHAASSAEYAVQMPGSSQAEIIIEALPTHPLTPGHEVMAAVSIDDGDPIPIRFEHGKDDEDDPAWQTNVLRNAMYGRTTVQIRPGPGKLKLWAADPSVVVQRIVVRPSPGTHSGN